jgi:HAD superfamily hydrolase (TIGR01549 family)
MAIKLIFFDFDGTILDSWGLIAGVFARVLDEFGVEYGENDIKMLGMKMVKILGKLGVSGDLTKDIGDRFFEYLDDEVREADLKSCVSADVLRELKRSFELVIVSNARREYVELALKRLGFGNLFSRIVGADEEDRDKDEIVVGLIEKLGLNKDEVIYVGDRFSDIRFARRAGVRCVAVSNSCSWSSRKELEREGADFLIGNLGELEDVISKI